MDAKQFLREDKTVNFHLGSGANYLSIHPEMLHEFIENLKKVVS